MAAETCTIEVDMATAEALQGRAAVLGVSVAKIVAGLTVLAAAPASLSADNIADLDSGWKAIKAGEATIPHDDVERWLGSWGTPSFRPWHDTDHNR